MKHEIKIPPAKFTPVTLRLVIESQAELDVLTCLARSSPVNAAIRDVFSVTGLLPVDMLQKAGGNPSKNATFSDALLRRVKSALGQG